ncbi:MAG: transcriptional repressor NrdR [Candidatus Kerfeldbacteria bacterium]|nr:transcriptional repressor NrdR [Candidatus Kerfeldbacteria bacterium]
MKCPVCLAADTKVTDSRLTSEGFAIRRRRECVECGFRFSTFEEVEILNLSVIKRDGRREPYSREKLENGLKKALEKRSVTQDDFRKLINRIERDIQHLQRSEITSRTIGELVMKRLKRFDSVAYIRFASVYRSFQDVASFQRELSELTKRRTKRPSPSPKRRTTS